MNITESWNDALNDVITFLPNLAAFLVILLIGWLVAKVVRKGVNMLLERVGFDRAVERGGVKRALEGSKYDASSMIAALVYYAILLVALQIAFGVFGPNPVSDLLNSLVAWLPQLIVAVVIVVVAAAVANAVGDIIGSALSSQNYGRLVARLVQAFIIGLGVIAALNQIGVATAVTTPVLIAVLATIAGVIVVGVGGGMLRPMEQRWERWLSRAEDEVSSVSGREAAYDRGREDALRAHETTTGVGGPERTTPPPPTEAPTTGYGTPPSRDYP